MQNEIEMIHTVYTQYALQFLRRDKNEKNINNSKQMKYNLIKNLQIQLI